jgi:acetoacetyl-CoA synthetase
MLTLSPSTLVQIKSGSEKTPVIVAHGLSGTVQVNELAEHILTQHPIYGIQARGLDGAEEPLDTVEQMAELYSGAIVKLSPNVPCILIGYSFGGLVALEVAQQMLARGKPIALLVVLDAYPHPRFMPAYWRFRLFLQRMKVHARQLIRLPLPEAISYCLNSARRQVIRNRARRETGEFIAEHGLPFSEAALQRVNQRAYHAYANYRPRFYPGKIRFVTTADKTFFPADPVQIWGHLTGGLQVETIPGTHYNILTTEFQPLAEVLTRYLRQQAESAAT